MHEMIPPEYVPLAILALVVAGFVLIVLDLMFIPGGLLILVGAAGMIISIVLNYNHYGLVPAIIQTVVCVTPLPWLVKWSLRRVSMKKEMHAEDGYVGMDSRLSHVGKQGTAVSDLRPSGTVLLVEGDREIHLDCIADGGYIEKGDTVEIFEERGPSLVCRKI